MARPYHNIIEANVVVCILVYHSFYESFIDFFSLYCTKMAAKSEEMLTLREIAN